MYYGKIITNDTANGKGIRLSLFVSGCTKHCKGCFNSDTWSFTYGEEFTPAVISYIVNELSKSYYDGITILGGEPLHPANRDVVLTLIREIKAAYPDQTIWVYTGYTYEELLAEESPILTDLFKNVDVLVDGEFIESQKDITLRFRGSSNQRLLSREDRYFIEQAYKGAANDR